MKEKLEELRKELEDVKRIEAEYKMKEGQYNDKMRAFIKDIGLPEQFTLVDALLRVSQ